MQTTDYALRAQKDTDHDFLAQLYASTRTPELASFGWDAQATASFLHQQFELQSRHYAQQFPDGEFWIIERNCEAVGRLCLYWGNTTVQLIDIALLPEHRGAGLGTALLQELLVRADARSHAVELHVEAHNRAQHLYQRLGFSIRDNKGVYLQMRRPAQYDPRPSAPSAKARLSETGQVLPDNEYKYSLATDLP
ncbi:GNAT family N-acetyltransferase [Marinobacterium rhizophilum]|uniref:GNAT family N-acetyltransferase n=1 Tax=Marinobacterium rhizophilum TaxID=420402 RepID=A0ABY5HL73_9GAMM|nr:GNAT family N-acetyltransferase [Marinobacterium rhizophilum]UTW13137.1 GNAT family N-acetyltransferase [Marinobacterium rhizophilum]